MPSPLTPELAAAVEKLVRSIDGAVKAGALPLAERVCRQALEIAPGHHGAALWLARIAFLRRQYAIAAVGFREALERDPADSDAWLALGRCHRFLRQWPEAVEALSEGMKRRAPSAELEAELGHFLANAGDIAESAACFRRSVSLDPDQPDVWNDLGAKQLDLGDVNAALGSFTEATARRVNFVEALRNLATVHEWRGEGAHALAIYDQLVAAFPTDASLKQARGALRLAHGRFVDGWADYRARFINPAHKGWHGGISKPKWLGEGGAAALAGKGIFVWSDQGLGDQVLVAGLLNDVAAAADHVVFGCEPRLIPLMQRSFRKVRVVSHLDVPFKRVDLSDVELEASISEIGPVFRPALESFPAHSGYLKADAAKVAQLKAQYSALPGEGPFIGIAWNSTNELAKGNKTVPLREWGPILKTPGVRFVCLQYGDVAREVNEVAKALGVSIHMDRQVDATADVDLFAAQVAAMDAVVTTSNTTVHLAGGLNVPTLCLAPLVEGRPWHLVVGQPRSPWYPSVRLIWQTQRGKWGDVIDRATSSLQNMLQSRR